MLIGTINVLSGGLHMYFLMSELTGGTSKFIMWCACLWINIFSQVISSFFLLTYILISFFNILAVLLISCQVFQKCDAMADWSVWFNLRFLQCSFVLVSKFRFVCPMYTFSHITLWISKFCQIVHIKKYICRPPEGTSMAQICIATMQDTSVDLNWELAQHRPKKLSSGKQITLVGGYWKMKIMTYLHC